MRKLRTDMFQDAQRGSVRRISTRLNSRTRQVLAIALAVCADFVLGLLEELAKTLAAEKDSEAVYRGLVSLGTLVMSLGPEIKSAAKDIYEINNVLAQISSSSPGKEPRIKGIIGEIQQSL